MKKIDFTQPGGFPLTQDTLNFMQTAYGEEMLRAWIAWLIEVNPYIATASTTRYIISGLYEVNKSGVDKITAGWVLIDGELMRFSETNLQTITDAGGIGTMEVKETATFKDNSTPEVYTTKTAVAGGLNPAMPDAFLRLINLQSMRPVINGSFVQAITPINPKGSVSYTKTVEGVSPGDVIALNIYHPESIELWKYLVVGAQVIGTDTIRVVLTNVADSVTIPSGDVEFKLRIIK